MLSEKESPMTTTTKPHDDQPVLPGLEPYGLSSRQLATLAATADFCRGQRHRLHAPDIATPKPQEENTRG